MLHLGMRGEMLEHLECGNVQPLQIIKKQREGVLRSSERSDEAAKHPLKAILALLRRELGHRPLLPDDERQLRDQVDDERAVRADRVEQDPAPSRHLLLALAEELARERLKGLSQSGIGDAA